VSKLQVGAPRDFAGAGQQRATGQEKSGNGLHNSSVDEKKAPRRDSLVHRKGRSMSSRDDGYLPFTIQGI